VPTDGVFECGGGGTGGRTGTQLAPSIGGLANIYIRYTAWNPRTEPTPYPRAGQGLTTETNKTVYDSWVGTNPVPQTGSTISSGSVYITGGTGGRGGGCYVGSDPWAAPGQGGETGGTTYSIFDYNLYGYYVPVGGQGGAEGAAIVQSAGSLEVITQGVIYGDYPGRPHD